MGTIRLFHWRADEGQAHARELRAAGLEVELVAAPTPQELRDLRSRPPDAFVISLERIPSQGRDLALALRHAKATRRVPLVFVGGQPDKVASIRELLPDAAFAGWDEIATAIRRAVASPPPDPIVPDSVMAGYSGTPLARKLGIRQGAVVALVAAPAGFEETLHDLPDDVTLRRSARGRCDLTLWFVRSAPELENGIERMAARLERGAMWIMWPKKASRLTPDLSQAVVRRCCLAVGLVDYKVCSVDATWSGLLFTRRKSRWSPGEPASTRRTAPPRSPARGRRAG